MFSPTRLAIDAGTSNTQIYILGKGVVLNEPTVVAMSTDDDKILAIGQEARDMIGRTPLEIKAARPMKDGVVADYDITESLIRYFLGKAAKSERLGKLEVLVCTPAGATSVERRAIVESVLAAGAKNAYLIEEALVAAIGANIPIGSNEGNMIVDIGGGTTEIAVICMGGIVTHATERIGGTHLDEAISQYVRRQHSLLIGERTAEDVKLKLASAVSPKEELNYEVKGRDTVSGLPVAITVTNNEIFQAIKPQLDIIISQIKQVLEQTPPELSSDIIDRGIVISGGGAYLPSLDRLVSAQTGVPVHIAENPQLSVMLGAGKVLEQFSTFEHHIRKY